MGTADVYCFVTGARYMKSVHEVGDTIIEDCVGDSDSMSQRKKRRGPSIPQNVVKGLRFTKEDVNASKNYVLICSYERQEDGKIKLLADFENDPPDELSDKNVKEVFNVVPGDMVEYGMYENLSPEEGDSGDYSLWGEAPKLIITHKAYVILKQAAPSLKPHVLLLLKCHADTSDRADEVHFAPGLIIDYGPVKRTQEQWSDWLALRSLDSNDPEPDRDVVIQAWKGVFSLKGKGSQSAILDDIWRGRGNLWCLVAPDKFPISDSASLFKVFDDSRKKPSTQSFTKLPLDILILICENLHPRHICALVSTCSFIRGFLLHSANQVVRAYITQNEPWFLPAGPFDDIPRGDDEIKFWGSEWSKLGHGGDNIDTTIPWLSYRRSCSRSLSMWNRIRIWRITRQMVELATKLGYID
ncbi:hypothetical protein BJ165DRAFT_1510279 [Panaeolus papilionaceus]|nr:hypothetical protein BJ165DRAFT_1510279 [Panaeolus papilionaceus]